MLLGTQKINARGELEVGGINCLELARRFGTPLYVMDEAHIREQCRRYLSLFRQQYPGEVEIVYAGKAFLPLAMCLLVEQEGLSLDVSTGGELYTAIRADFPGHRIHLHGNNKSDVELEMALSYPVGRIIIDSLQEINQIERLCKARGVDSSSDASARVDVVIRVTPGIKAQTHTYIQTAQLDVKFGLGITSGQALEGTRRVLASRHLRLRGFHCHIGSQLFGLDSYRQAVRVMADFMGEVKRQAGYEAEELNLGGGLGIRYVSDDRPPSLEEFSTTLITAVTTHMHRVGLRLPKLILEPGRSIVGEAGLTLYTAGVVKETPGAEDKFLFADYLHTAGVVKEIPGIRTYVSVDGGMSDNPRPALYQAVYELIVANKADQEPVETVTIAGKHCETDVLIYNAATPLIEPGDIIAVQSTGAYNHSMASNYNRVGRPPVVFVMDGQADLVVEREALDDLIAHDRIPQRLRFCEARGASGVVSPFGSLRAGAETGPSGLMADR